MGDLNISVVLEEEYPHVFVFGISLNFKLIKDSIGCFLRTRLVYIRVKRNSPTMLDVPCCISSAINSAEVHMLLL